jgi:hypothetical protein
MVSVALICSIPLARVVKPSLPVHSVADLINLAKELPPELRLGRSGHVHSSHRRTL